MEIEKQVVGYENYWIIANILLKVGLNGSLGRPQIFENEGVKEKQENILIFEFYDKYTREKLNRKLFEVKVLSTFPFLRFFLVLRPIVNLIQLLI